MGEVIDFHEWKEKKDRKRIFNEIDQIFSITTTSRSIDLNLNYYVMDGQVLGPFTNFTDTSD
jgi:hypothetical protein